MAVFKSVFSLQRSLRTRADSVSAGAVTVALLSSASTALAGDYHFNSSGNVVWQQLPSSGFEAPIILQAGDRAIYDRAGTGQSMIFGPIVRNVGQLVFRAPYTGSGFANPPGSLTGPFAIHGLEGLGVDSKVDQQITLSEQLIIAGSQEWRVDSATGSVTQLGRTASRSLSLGSYMLTLNAVGAGNSFILNNPVSGTGGLIVKGAGTTFLNNANTYSGGTFLDGGTAVVTADNNLGAASGGLGFDGGTLRLGSSFATARAVALAAGGGTIDSNGNNATLSGDISGIGGLTVAGTGTVTLTGSLGYTGATDIEAGTLMLSGAASLANSSVVIADGVFDVSTVGGASTEIRSLSGAGSVVLGTTQLVIANAADSYSGLFLGTGGLTLQGGMQELTGNSAGFGGTSRIEGGTLAVNGRLGGVMDVLGGRLQGNGQVGNTASFLGGVIAPGNSIGTLTIAGSHTGNGGMLEIETELGGDGSPTDLLVITGDSILGSGPTQVRVINVGGIGGVTTGDGIKIVDVGGVSAAGAFVLAGPAIAGTYRYDLFQNGLSGTADGDWYLRSAGLAPTLPTYEIYPQVLLDLVGLPTLQQRAGVRHRVAIDGTGSQEGGAVWSRIEAAHGRSQAQGSTTNAAFDSNTLRLQAGIDGQIAADAGGMLIGGLNLHYGRTSADIFSDIGGGTNGTSSYGLGGTLTWYGERGIYVDGQAQVSVLRSDFASNQAGSIGKDIHGSGYALSLEAGRQVGIGNGWSLTPQAQLAYSAVSFDSFTDPFGAEVSLKDGDSLKGRIGLSADWRRDAGTHVYGVASLTYEFLDGTTATVNGMDLTYRPERLGGEIGLGGAYRWNDGRYALHGEALATTSFQDSYGFKGSVGFTAGL